MVRDLWYAAFATFDTGSASPNALARVTVSCASAPANAQPSNLTWPLSCSNLKLRARTAAIRSGRLCRPIGVRSSTSARGARYCCGRTPASVACSVPTGRCSARRCRPASSVTFDLVDREIGSTLVDRYTEFRLQPRRDDAPMTEGSARGEVGLALPAQQHRLRPVSQSI